MKINPDETTFREILAGLERHRNSEQWVKDDGRFIPHPTTWLNGERWKDEVKQAKVGAAAAQKNKYANLGKTIAS